MSSTSDDLQQIDLARPTFGPEELEAVARVLESGWVAGQGPQGTELESAFKELCGVPYAVALSSCTTALHLALAAHDVGPGDEVLVADYTYPATGHSVLFCGATPTFVDVQPDTGTIDPEAAAAAITDRTVGIMAVDVFGQPADYQPLEELAAKHGLFLIEDAAAGVGATYQGRPTGGFGDVATFSLHARKGITSGEGGVLTTDDEQTASYARKLSAFGVESAYSRHGQDQLAVPVFTDLGYNYKLSDIQAAIGLAQLDKLPGFLQRRAEIATAYGELLGDIDGIQLPHVAADRTHTWQTYAVTVDDALDRGRVAMAMRRRGVGANIGTYASHLQPVYDDPQPCPVSADLFARHLAIPMHANLTEGQLERVAVVIKEAISEVATQKEPA